MMKYDLGYRKINGGGRQDWKVRVAAHILLLAFVLVFFLFVAKVSDYEGRMETVNETYEQIYDKDLDAIIRTN